MVIYIDNDYICHLIDDGTMKQIETDAFDGKEKAYIEGYRYIPEGETWVRSDGVEFTGIMVAPAKDYTRIMTEVAIGYLTDEQAESVTVLFEEWQENTDYVVDDRRQYNGLLYRCIQAHTSQSNWTPNLTPALWVRTSTDEWPEWVQPTGAHDAYNTGDKVSHNDKHWISDVNSNIWEPGIYGWTEVGNE